MAAVLKLYDAVHAHSGTIGHSIYLLPAILKASMELGVSPVSSAVNKVKSCSNTSLH